MTETPPLRVKRRHNKRYVPLAALLLAMAFTGGQVGPNAGIAAQASRFPIVLPKLPPLLGGPKPVAQGVTPPGAPIRAAFYYPWYSEAWHQGNPDPWTKYRPSLGYYDSSSYSVMQTHIRAMQYGKIQAGIASWWGPGNGPDSRIIWLLYAARGTGFQWALYYEKDLSVSGIRADLAYINKYYANDPNYLHVNGKPVLFVYGRSLGNCQNAATWVNTNAGAFYLDLEAFPGYQSCWAHPDNYHVYGPSYRSGAAPNSFSISPGFFKATDLLPTLPRNPAAFDTACKQMVQSKDRWQLVTTFNEFGEGTQVESTTSYASRSGYGAYLDVLHNC